MRLKRRFLSIVSLVALLAVLPVGAARAAQGPPDIAEQFRDYYTRHQGIRVLGYPQSGLVEVNGYPAQYFEKGRIEDHRADRPGPNWIFMYGRLTAELIERNAPGSVSATTVTYADLRRYHDPSYRNPAPPKFAGGVVAVHDGMFVPYDPQLRPSPGYVVAPYFWAYINRGDLFPGGWLHDVGLPVTEPMAAVVDKGPDKGRQIVVQAFQRTILTYDPLNPDGWQVERANVGTDYARAFPDRFK